MKKQRQFTSAQECAKNIFLSALLLLLALPTYGQIEYNFAWMGTTNLSEAKSRMGAASLGTKAYFAGGNCGNTVFSTVEIYDTAVGGGTWTFAENLSVARNYPAGVACDGKIFFAGGYTGTDVSDRVDIFNAPDGTLLETIHLSVPRLTGAVANDSIVIFAGGLIGLEVPWATTDIVEFYNTNKEAWEDTTATLSVARDARAAVVVGDLAIFAGGHTGTGVSNAVDIYDFSTGNWSTDNLSVARGNIAATVVGDKAFFAGGADNNSNSSKVVDIYDASNGTWATAELSVPRAFLGSINAATICGKAFFVGGGDVNYNTGNWTEAYDVIDIYDANKGAWDNVEYLNGKRNNHAVVAIDEILLVTGDACESIVEKGSCIVGVSSFDPESEYTIYPNPAKDELIVNASFKNQTSGTLALFDVMGRTLYHYKFDKNRLDHQIDLSSFSPGIYLIEIKINSERFIEKVMILE